MFLPMFPLCENDTGRRPLTRLAADKLSCREVLPGEHASMLRCKTLRHTLRALIAGDPNLRDVDWLEA